MKTKNEFGIFADKTEVLQKVEVGLLVAFPNDEDCKKHLEWYKVKWEEEYGKIN
ncbi:hypothetical protein H1220_04420 [Carnobacteriaceae bacterium zg-84]|uniref:hypothetical protein n=1 Tax=Granulicatella sp. zg-84 TaxID=2678503 RepID=UPI0013C107C1|nr:hypothetical protein [Granulicatella sp. zg-84]NEW66065.1 hypothetical protein [Granulicatella sp. zg-84]QMI86595.1 hypothetical protein H1220_04420 [Carnobacteriaceae bacterium zg-84]